MDLEVLHHSPTAAAKPAPILFVHGAWHAAWCWEEYFMPYFAAQGYDTYALSLRGHGKSDGHKYQSRWRIKDYVADVAQIAQTLPATPIVIGHSMGGHVVQKYLEIYAAPAGVLLATSPVHTAIFATLRTAKRLPLSFLKTNLILNLRPLANTPEKARQLFFSEDFPPEQLASYQARLHGESYLAFLGLLGLERIHPKRIHTPMLVLGAENDNIFSPWEEQRTARAYNTTAEIFPNMAHDMMVEADWQKVADRIITWLNSHAL